jgi:hypothetical protein
MAGTSQYKMLFFFARNASLSPDEFKDYYENKHVPLILSLVDTMEAHGIDESSKPLLYKRRYIDRDASNPASGNPGMFDMGLPPFEYDVVTEIVFASKTAAADFVKVLYGIEENASRLLPDEDKLMDRSKMRGFVVEEHVS